jgi:hypothetical protein
MVQNLLEKLQFTEQKNILIQGLPSSIEKQFAKIAFAKNVTPLLRTRRIDFALVFAVNVNQLSAIMRDVLPALQEDGIFWIAHPKASSKIATDLSKTCSWDCVHNEGFEILDEVTLDHVWIAARFKKKVAVLKTSRSKTSKRAELQASAVSI